MKRARLRLALSVVAMLSVASFVIQAAVMRPHLSGLASVVGRPITVVAVHPGGVADRAGIAPGAIITAVEDSAGHSAAIGSALTG